MPWPSAAAGMRCVRHSGYAAGMAMRDAGFHRRTFGLSVQLGLASASRSRLSSCSRPRPCSWPAHRAGTVEDEAGLACRDAEASAAEASSGLDIAQEADDLAAIGSWRRADRGAPGCVELVCALADEAVDIATVLRFGRAGREEQQQRTWQQLAGCRPSAPAMAGPEAMAFLAPDRICWLAGLDNGCRYFRHARSLRAVAARRRRPWRYASLPLARCWLKAALQSRRNTIQIRLGPMAAPIRYDAADPEGARRPTPRCRAEEGGRGINRSLAEWSAPGCPLAQDEYDAAVLWLARAAGGR